ncbi:VanZ family protein [Alkalihalobacillus sp. 1P02AB]|uniref:VanZ family protein n=1 Tax=Alkalihalobacillus sp. 1P02AB TaxID=3132260 RepID=UPI0039A5B501
MNKSIIWALLLSQVLFFSLIPIWLELTNHLHSLVIIVVWVCLTGFTFITTSIFTNTLFTFPKSLIDTLIFSYSFGLIILLFFRPGVTSYSGINFIPFETVTLFLFGNVPFLIAFYNVSANVGLFIPFGLYYRYIRKKPKVIELFVMTLLTISAIELLQYTTQRGIMDIDDLILNTTGVLLGYNAQPILAKVIKITRPS